MSSSSFWSSLTGLQFEFAHPWWWLILPLPFLVHFLIPAYRTRQLATKVPFFRQLSEALGAKPTRGASQLSPRWWQRAALVLSWLLLVTALAKPMVLGEPQTRERMGRDLMVLVDLSGSMAEKDFTSDSGAQITRLAAAKQVLADFAKTRKGDRLGLILFGDAAFVQTPFTADQAVWLALLQQTDVAMAGQSTHLGDAMGLAIKVFEQSAQSRIASGDTEPREQVAIVLTDGNDTGSFVEPVEAAKVAAAKSVRIYMIAMGDPRTVGESALDMDTINQVAALSGGKAFSALNRQELAQAYEQVGKLEPQLYESTTYRPKQSVHYYLIALVVVIYLTAFIFASVQRHPARIVKPESVKASGGQHG
ncbi:VWA domain-containing protein [Photobacterium aphoticum]|uniref:Aerotolerance regulator BatA n=1 Tax=Photobacterium aphoticum TaxID=754436 RepID=A0A0J1GFY0_9GAMM|nr:VWA domain-containing protein [Photobacterium aphoticum]KLU98475.1 aerotolerance regulator BatA [Photobacterium aphoticum]PSU57419.1 VWA domain-containing protein [Photobacterium aphoticum]GHA63480.1 VWA domain-containing protein [Photobacterium aphoticum]